MALRRTFSLITSLAVSLGAAALLAGCDEQGFKPSEYRAFAPLSPESLELMRAKSTNQNAPMLIRAYKKEAELEIWKQKTDGKYVLFKTYPMCRWSGQLGPKVTEGDRQVPEGFYTITPGSMNPNSHYYLSFNVGYPNAYDRANGHTGGSIMVHGICSSAGCFSMTDKQIEEIYAVARESFAGGQRAIQMQSYPFHMTAENLTKLRLDRNMAFWRELKKGSDYFEVTKLETPVGVCNKKYVFGATPKNGSFDALSSCPLLEEDPEVKTAVDAKAAADDRDVAELVSKGVKPVKLVYADGGQNDQFKTERIAEVSRPDALAAGAQEIALDETSKAKPVAVQVAAAKATRATAAKVPAPAETKVAAATPANASLVPATFQAAPSAYASEEPKTSTMGALKSLFGQSAETPQAAPAVDAQPVATVVKVADATPATAVVNSQAAKHPKSAPAPIASNTSAVPVAPPVAAQGEPKAGTISVLKGWLNLGSADPAPAVPVANDLPSGSPAPVSSGQPAGLTRTTSVKHVAAKVPAKTTPLVPAPVKPQQLSSRLPEEITGKPESWLSSLRAFSPID